MEHPQHSVALSLEVGTGHYGADARSFANGKPITLVDGDELLEMLGDYGWRYRIGTNARVGALLET